MAKNHLNILFWLYKSKINKEGKAPLYFRVTYSNRRKNYSTGFNISPARWDTKRGMMKGINEEAKQVNAFILQSQSRLMDLFNEMLQERDVNLEILLDRFKDRNSNSHTLLELVNQHNSDFEARIGTDYTFSTFEKYDILRRKLEAFIPYVYHKNDIRLKELAPKFMADFDFYLKNHDHNEHNTATKYLKNLKKILNVGVINGWIKENPFAVYKSSYKDVDRIYLTQSELDSIEAKSFTLPRLSLVKDLFLFQCYTGLAYSDMAKLTQKNVSVGIDGAKWIITHRRKTDVRAAIPLLLQAEELIEKYSGNTELPESLLFPCYSIQRFNSYLNEIADLCGIHKNLTSHVGRRTFATTIAMANGVGLETISKILGHTTTKITAQYAVVTDHQVGRDIAKLRQKLVKKKQD